MSEFINDLPENISCPTERYEATVPVKEFLHDCVDVDYFLSLCRQCPNYGKIWSCPEYDFDVRAYWKRFKALRIIGIKIIVPEDIREQVREPDEMHELYKRILLPVKEQLSKEMYALEESVPGSVHLSAGSCMLCPQGSCARRGGSPCRFPDKMRYSIESLGGNVTKAAEYLGQTLEWAGPDCLPHHFLLIAGLLH